MYKIRKAIAIPVLLVSAFIVIICVLYGTGLLNFFSLETLQCYARDLMNFVKYHYWVSIFIYEVLLDHLRGSFIALLEQHLVLLRHLHLYEYLWAHGYNNMKPDW
jgi:hypothetical protein